MSDYQKQLHLNNPEAIQKPKIEPKEDSQFDDEFGGNLMVNISIGKRCQIIASELRGVVIFIGKMKSHGFGYFVGVQLDEPMGDCNGTLDGVCYFQCLPKFGKIVRPHELLVGDFPELDY